MGQSTDAILFYGYTWADAKDLLNTDGEDIDTYDLGEGELAETYGIGIDSHCSCDYAIPFIYIKESYIQSSRGDSSPVDVTKFAKAPTDKWNDRLDKFIEEASIDMSVDPEYDEPVKGPGWFLVSDWC